MSSSKDLDLNSDIMSEHLSDGVSGARVSDFSASSDGSGEIRASGAEKVVVEPVIRVSVGENPSGGFDAEHEEQRDGTEVRGFDVLKDDLASNERRTGIEVVRGECVKKTTETLIEQVEIAREGEVVAEHKEMVGDALDDSSSRKDKDHSTEVKAVCVSADENVQMEANADLGEKIDLLRNEKPETVTRVVETVAEADCKVSESDMHLEKLGRDSEVLPTEAPEFPSCPEEENRIIEPESESEQAVVSRKRDENHTIESLFSAEEASQFDGKESNAGTLVVDLDCCLNVERKQNNGIDIALEAKNAGDGAAKIQHESNDRNLEPETPSEKEHQASYGSATDKEGEFFVSDLVWGKVKSHPWWPGQIFDPSDATEQAMKYYKKDRYLVAYFGDQTFAWNEASSLKPFQTHFSQMEKQSSLETFRGAIDSALDEVSRRVQLGLSCSCKPEEVHAKVKSPCVCNSGIREDVCQKDGEDKSFGITSFEPDKLVEFIKASALHPCSGGDLLELVIAQAQLTAFYQWKGYFGLPEFHVYGGLFENDIEYASSIIKNEEQESTGKRKMKRRYNSFRRTCEYILEDDMNPMRKKRSLSELMGGSNSSADHVNGVKNVPGEKNASTSASASSGSKRRHFRSRDLNVTSSTSTSAKVGERISRIASRLAGSPPALSYSKEKFPEAAVKEDRSNEKLREVDGSAHSTKRFRRRRVSSVIKQSAPYEMLSQLSLAARDPVKGYSFLSTVVDFFTNYRNLITEENSSSLMDTVNAESFTGNMKPSKYKMKSHGTYNYRSVNECYLSDSNIPQSQEEQKSVKTRKRKRSYQCETPTEKDGSSLEAKGFIESKPSLQSEDRLTVEQENNFKLSPKVNSGQQSPNSNSNLPTALILNFTEANSIPSKRVLNEIFSRFGALSESETEVLKKNKRAKVVFQCRSDAEAAFSSAGKFSTFGPALVSYQLTYLAAKQSKASPHNTRQSRKDTASS